MARQSEPERLPAEQLTVGDIARRSGVAVSTLHFYEAKGLIESTRTSGNQRRYERTVLRRIPIIRLGQRAGLSLAFIKQHLGKLPHGPVDQSAWRDLREAWRSDLDQRIVSLVQLRDQLDHCIGCGCLSLAECQMRNPQDILAGEGCGPCLLDADR